MPEDTKNNTNEVDLSELSNIEFQTAWTPSSKIEPARTFAPRGNFKKHFNKKPSDGEFRQKRRPKFENGEGGQRQFPAKKPFNKKQKHFDKKRPQAPFSFTMDVQIFPEDAPFNKLCDIIKESKRTYQLFEIAQLVLEKRERMVVLAKNLPDSDNIVKPLFCAQPLNIPFEDEQSAKNAAEEYFLKEMFATEQVEAEPPKGTFLVVNKCTLSGDLLGAPNWHKYNEFVREYHKSRFPKMSFDDFLKTIESVKGEEVVNEWLEKMKTKTVYKLKEPAEGDPEFFETSDAAKAFIASKKEGELVKVYEQVRMSLANIEFMPFGRIRRNIEETVRKEKRFPINTANNMRGKLRRCGLSVYKRGSKGFAFVSLVKRKFLTEGETLAELPQKIFDFLLVNPSVKFSEAPFKILGLEVQPAEEQKQQPIDAEAAQSPVQALPESFTQEQKQQLNAVYSELMWLISEGYVVEYADGALQANPYMPKPKDKTAQPEAKTDDEPAAPASETAANEPAVAEKAEAQETAAEAPAEQPAQAQPEQPAETADGQKSE